MLKKILEHTSVYEWEMIELFRAVCLTAFSAQEFLPDVNTG